MSRRKITPRQDDAQLVNHFEAAENEPSEEAAVEELSSPSVAATQQASAAGKALIRSICSGSSLELLRPTNCVCAQDQRSGLKRSAKRRKTSDRS
jgi:hypothetical protein